MSGGQGHRQWFVPQSRLGVEPHVVRARRYLDDQHGNLPRSELLDPGAYLSGEDFVLVGLTPDDDDPAEVPRPAVIRVRVGGHLRLVGDARSRDLAAVVGMLGLGVVSDEDATRDLELGRDPVLHRSRAPVKPADPLPGRLLQAGAVVEWVEQDELGNLPPLGIEEFDSTDGDASSHGASDELDVERALGQERRGVTGVGHDVLGHGLCRELEIEAVAVRTDEDDVAVEDVHEVTESLFGLTDEPVGHHAKLRSGVFALHEFEGGWLGSRPEQRIGDQEGRQRCENGGEAGQEHLDPPLSESVEQEQPILLWIGRMDLLIIAYYLFLCNIFLCSESAIIKAQ